MVARFSDLPPAERRRATETLAAARATGVERWPPPENLTIDPQRVYEWRPA